MILDSFACNICQRPILSYGPYSLEAVTLRGGGEPGREFAQVEKMWCARHGYVHICLSCYDGLEKHFKEKAQ